jgi:hypothetical protein
MSDIISEGKMNSLKSTAKAAGLLYLLVAVCAPFSMLYIPSKLIVSGDAAATVNNLMASETLFRMGFVGDSVVFLLEIVLVVLLYVLFKPVNPTLSLVAAFSRLAMAIVQGINLLNYFYALLIVGGASYLAVFGKDQLQALVLLFINAHEYGAYIWGVFFGLHLVVLGYLVFRSGYFPKMMSVLLGAALVVGSVGYLTDSFGNWVLPNHQGISIMASVFIMTGSLGELLLALWLLIKGVQAPLMKRDAV